VSDGYNRTHAPLGEGWHARFDELIQAAESELLICSPFVSRRGIVALLSNLSTTLIESGSLILLTDLSPLAACQGATDPAAIADLAANVAATSVVHLPRLHAKVYIADSKRAIVTSGNLTAGGLFQNFEYGVESRDAAIVGEIASDIKGYAGLGAVLDRSRLERYREIAGRAHSAYELQKAAIDRAAKEEVARLINEAQDELISTQLSRGSMTSIFSGTILYLLKRHGPLDTEAIHPLVEQIHPDLCDNGVDRIINGRRFGKKWKHAVRTAQQRLKERGDVTLLEHGRWSLT
jgi:phosphatidylserine/phosphatidylglycerophosphate/cardiolipin synthase-like enzyme